MSETNSMKDQEINLVKGVHKELAQSRYTDNTQNFIRNILEEKKNLGENFPLVNLLIEQALERIYTTGQIPGREFYADVYKQKPLKVTQKVFLPLKEFPFNFTGKLLGPRGNTLRRLQQETQCKIVIKGRNSIRDAEREEKLRSSGDPKYAHFHRELYLEISTIAQPAESYARIAYALAELRKYINPNKNDEVSQGQLREMMKIDPEMAKSYSSHVEAHRAPEYTRSYAGRYPKTEYTTYYDEPLYHQNHRADKEELDDPRSFLYRRQRPPQPQPPQYEYSRARPYNSTPKRFDPIIYATETKRGRGEDPTVLSTSYRRDTYAGYRQRY